MKTKKAPAAKLSSEFPVDTELADHANPPSSGELVLANLETLIVTGNDRDRLDPKTVRELAASMASVGLLQPVGVCRAFGEKGAMRLVYGFHRVAAAKMINWKDIPAIVLEIDDHRIADARLIENAQRIDLNPIEETIAVCGMLDDALDSEHNEGEGDWTFETASVVQRENAIANIALRLGKPATWVRDRSFLARLPTKARALVVEGRLPFVYARELLKVADPRLRESLAMEFAAPKELGALPGDFGDLKDAVAKQMMSLATVPWKLDVEFGIDDLPPCTTCPHNSVNSPGLFEHVRPASTRAVSGWGASASFVEPKAGVCTKRECFDAKLAIANRQVAAKASTLARRVRDLPKTERPDPTNKTIVDDAAKLKVEVPTYLDPALVRERFEEEMERRPAPKAAKKAAAVNNPAKALQTKAQRELESALWQRGRKMVRVIGAALNKADALTKLAMLVVMKSKVVENIGCGGKKTSQSAIDALVAMLKAPTMAKLEAEGKFLQFDDGDIDVPYDHEFFDQVAGALGVACPPRPTLEEFMKEPPAAKGRPSHDDGGDD